MLISHFFSTRLSEALKESRVIDGSDMLQYEYCLEYLFDIILYNSSLILIGGMLHDSNSDIPQSCHLRFH